MFSPNAALFVYQGEFGLPSIDHDCLRALCAVKFTRTPIKIETVCNPLLIGSLPYLKNGSQTIVGYRKIKKFLDLADYSINTHLNDEKIFLSTALSNYIFEKLHSYYFYHLYGISTNFDITRSLYAKRTPFPFSFYYPGKFYDKTEKIIDVLENFEVFDKIENHDTNQMILDAKRCINLLSRKLGNKVWFLGNYFSEFDGIVYSYISVLYHITLPTNPIQAHLKECKNLVNFINRITKDIFRGDGYSSKSKNTLESSKKSSADTILTPSEQEFNANKRKTQIFAGIGAFICMGTFAIYNGLLKISYDGSYDDENFDIDDDDKTD